VDVANIGDIVVGPADIGPAGAWARSLDGSRAADSRTVAGSPVGAGLVVVAAGWERPALVGRALAPEAPDWTRLVAAVERVAPVVVAAVGRGIRLGSKEAMRTETEAVAGWMGPTSRVAEVVVAAVVAGAEPAVGWRLAEWRPEAGFVVGAGAESSGVASMGAEHWAPRTRERLAAS
jgi:hypothetical protein